MNMKQTPFNPETDLPTTPFSEAHCHAAREMKQAGLDWTPHVGCFVWDPDEHIAPTSPFPNRIYFILNLGRFLQTFESIDAIRQKLVWLPTWNQSRALASNLGINDKQVSELVQKAFESNMDETLELYKEITAHLRTKGGSS
jgi:hypothetical protein